jgi:hypothetical protein
MLSLIFSIPENYNLVKKITKKQVIK